MPWWRGTACPGHDLHGSHLLGSYFQFTIEQVFPKLVPYLLAMIALLLVVTYVPVLSLGLPSVMGLL